MSVTIINSEKEFKKEGTCAYNALDFIKTIETDVKWWFKVAYRSDWEDKYSILFTSYETEEYKDYILSIEAKKENDSWEYTVFKKIDGLTK